MSDFSALHVALSGLRAAQLGMNTASHNVANAGTPGFTRQRVDLVARLPRITPQGAVGLGVETRDISRIRDGFLDARVRASVASLGALEVRAGILGRAEQLMGEPESGISSELDALWSAFEDAALDPAAAAPRIAVLQRLDAVAGRVTAVAAGLDALADDAAVTLEAVLEEVNRALEEVATLNGAILDAPTVAGSPNDLMDRRDLLVDRLATLVGATAAVADDGSIRVSLGGISLVAGAIARPLELDRSTGQVLHPSGVAVVPGGEARGYQLALTEDLPGLRADLDAFAVDLATALNTIHASGFSNSGPGGPLLSFDPGDPSGSLRRALADPAAFATAATAGPPFPAFDASVPGRLAALRTEPVAAGGSLADVVRSMVAGLGQETASARMAAATQAGLTEAAETSRSAVHGVSIDEEMVDLMEFQRMYEAAARVITAVDEALDTLINRMGVVGR
jgi:flagellar hook-associated protein 1 FlgK